MLLICFIMLIIFAAAVLMFFLNFASKIIVYVCLAALAAYGIWTLIFLIRKRRSAAAIEITCRCGRTFRTVLPRGNADHTAQCPYCQTLCHVTVNRGRHFSESEKRSVVISAAGILALIILIGMILRPSQPRVRYYTVPDSYYNYGTATEEPGII